MSVSDIVKRNISAVFLTSGAITTVMTAPPVQPSQTLVQIGGGGLILAGLALFVLKNAPNKMAGFKTASALTSGIGGLIACLGLAGNGAYTMATAADPNWLKFGGFIFAANVLPYFFGNGAVTVDAIRALKHKSKEFKPTNFNGIALNFVTGGLGLFCAGLSVYPSNQETGKNLMLIGLQFTISGLGGVGYKTLPTIGGLVGDVLDAARQAKRIFRPLTP